MEKIFTIEIKPEGVGEEQLAKASILAQTIAGIAVHLGLHSENFQASLALVVETDEPRLETILGVLAGEPEQGETKFLKDALVKAQEIREAWIAPEDTQFLDSKPVEPNGHKPRQASHHISQEKNIQCPRCNRWVGELTKKGYCKVCAMVLARRAKRFEKVEAREAEQSLGESKSPSGVAAAERS